MQNSTVSSPITAPERAARRPPPLLHPHPRLRLLRPPRRSISSPRLPQRLSRAPLPPLGASSSWRLKSPRALARAQRVQCCASGRTPQPFGQTGEITRPCKIQCVRGARYVQKKIVVRTGFARSGKSYTENGVETITHLFARLDIIFREHRHLEARLGLPPGGVGLRREGSDVPLFRRKKKSL